MRYARAIREGFMNCSRSILPRVGGGVGVGGRGRNVVLHSSYLTTRDTDLWITLGPADHPPMQRAIDGGAR